MTRKRREKNKESRFKLSKREIKNCRTRRKRGKSKERQKTRLDKSKEDQRKS